MKTLLALCVMFLLSTAAQAQHSIATSWGAPSDCAAPAVCTYNVKRAVGACAAPLQTLTLVGTTTNLNFNDTTVVPQVYCVAVTASLNGAESVPATATATVPLAGVTTLVVVGK